MQGDMYNKASAGHRIIVLAYHMPNKPSPTSISDKKMTFTSSGRKMELDGGKWLMPSDHFEGGLFGLPAARLPCAAVMFANKSEASQWSAVI